MEKETFEPIGFEDPADEEEQDDEGEGSEEATKGKEEEDSSVDFLSQPKLAKLIPATTQKAGKEP